MKILRLTNEKNWEDAKKCFQAQRPVAVSAEPSWMTVALRSDNVRLLMRHTKIVVRQGLNRTINGAYWFHFVKFVPKSVYT